MATSSTFTADNADDYEQLMGRWSRRLSEPFLDFAGLRDGDRVLDVGCGTGSLAMAVARRAQVASVVGIDLATAYLERARRDCPDPRIEFHQGDALSLPVEDGRFDRAFSMLVLQFVPDSAKAVAELRRSLRPGGTAAAVVWDIRGGVTFNRMFFDTAAALLPLMAERRKNAYTRPLSRPGELAQAWRTAGLRDVRDTVLTIRMDYTSFEDYWAPMTKRDGPIAAAMQELSTDEQALIKNKVYAAYVDGDPDGPRSYSASAFAVAGTAP